MPVMDPDGWYEELMNAHRGLADEQSRRLNCALVLLLANRMANMEELRHCLVQARSAAIEKREFADGCGC